MQEEIPIVGTFRPRPKEKTTCLLELQKLMQEKTGLGGRKTRRGGRGDWGALQQGTAQTEDVKGLTP